MSLKLSKILFCLLLSGLAVPCARAEDGGAFDGGGYKLNPVFKHIQLTPRAFSSTNGFLRHDTFTYAGFRVQSFARGKDNVKRSTSGEGSKSSYGGRASFYQGGFHNSKSAVASTGSLNFHNEAKASDRPSFSSVASGLAGGKLGSSMASFNNTSFHSDSSFTDHRSYSLDKKPRTKSETDDLIDESEISKLKPYEPFSTVSAPAHSGMPTNGYLNHHLSTEQKSNSGHVF